MHKKTILMAGIFGMLATSSVFAEEFPIEGVTIEGSTEIAIGEVDENGNPIPITIGNTLTEEEKEQRNPILSIEETREGDSVTVALSEAGKNNGDALVDLTVTDSGGNEVYFEKVASLEDEKHETAMVESVAVSSFSFSVLSVSDENFPVIRLALFCLQMQSHNVGFCLLKIRGKEVLHHSFSLRFVLKLPEVLLQEFLLSSGFWI